MKNQIAQASALLFQGGGFLILCIGEILLYAFFAIGCLLLFSLDGPSATTYFIMGLLYLFTLGRKGMFSHQRWLSLATLPCFFPASFFCMIFLKSASEAFYLAIWFFFAQWPKLFPSSQVKQLSEGIIKKVLFFAVWQCACGVALHRLYPEWIEPLEWTIALPALQPNHKYPSQTEIQFFYEDLEEAIKIEEQLPGVLATLSRSEFYQRASQLVLIQKPKMVMTGLSEKYSENIAGAYYSPKQYSYYFSEHGGMFASNPIYYSHANTYRAMVLHELSHQMLARYYGKWYTIFFIDTWKNEGYAEYMVGLDCYSTQEELRAIWIEHDISDAALEHPFSKGIEDTTGRDYLAAFLQTRYALDEKRIPLIDFMKSSYKTASAQDLKEWLGVGDNTKSLI